MDLSSPNLELATIKLADLDNELQDNLSLLQDNELERVLAHLDAGFPLRIAFGWEVDNNSGTFKEEQMAECGCLVGVAMTFSTFTERIIQEGGIYGMNTPTSNLAQLVFPYWVYRQLPNYPIAEPIPRQVTDRLKGFVEVEMGRRAGYRALAQKIMEPESRHELSV